MYYVGMDVHLRRSSLEVLDQHGGLVRRLEVKGPWGELLGRVRELPRPVAVCYEASCGYGYLHEKLSAMAERVAVARPGQLRLIFRAKKKNDRVDAGKLAKLLYLDEAPEVYVPGADVRAWRALIVSPEDLVQGAQDQAPDSRPAEGPGNPAGPGPVETAGNEVVADAEFAGGRTVTPRADARRTGGTPGEVGADR